MSGQSELIHARFFAAAEAHSHKPALITERNSVRYDALAGKVRRVASAVDTQKMRRVALSLPNGVELAEAFFGAITGGAVAMVWDPSWPMDLVDRIASEHPPDLLADGTWKNWLEKQPDPHAIQSQANGDMPFLVGFTSGSSGTPKAFIRSHRSWVTSFEVSAKEFGLTAQDVVAIPGPMSHGLSLYAMAEALCCGATVLCHSAFSDASFVKLMESQAATLLVAPPVLLDMLTTRTTEPLPHLRAIITAGDKLQRGPRERAAQVWPQADIIEYYGASELSFISVAKSSEQAPQSSVGRAFQGVEIEIRDSHGATLPAGEEGEVWVKSQMLSDGYIGEPASAFRKAGPWATVGDRGVLSSERWLTLTGRANDMMISAGHNVSPVSVEMELAKVIAAPVAVIGLSDPRWGQVVCAVKEASTPWSQDERDSAVEAVLQKLPKAALPRVWRTMKRMPRLSSGKVDRRALTETMAGSSEDG